MPNLVRAVEKVKQLEGPSRTIPTTISLPVGDGPFPFVVMFHGTGSSRHEAGNGYDLLASRLAEAGIASARFDFAGNGESQADHTEYSLTGGMEDGLTVIDHMREIHKVSSSRIGVLGWSQGGTVAMLAASRYPGIRSLVTWAGAIDISAFAAEKYEEAKQNGFAVVEFDWRPPLNLSIQWFEEARTIDIADELSKFRGALLAIAGARDTVVDPTVADAILAAAKSSGNKRKKIIAGADHTFNILAGDMTAFNQLIHLSVDRFADTL